LRGLDLQESLGAYELDYSIHDLLSELSIVVLQAIDFELFSHLECQLVPNIAIPTRNQIECIGDQVRAEINQDYLVSLIIVLDNWHLVLF
jgi:hypothetical protein